MTNNAAPILRVENCTMQFGGVVAVDNFSMEVFPNEIVALIGPRGEDDRVQLYYRRLRADERPRFLRRGADGRESSAGKNAQAVPGRSQPDLQRRRSENAGSDYQIGYGSDVPEYPPV